MQYVYDYPRASVTVDIIVFCMFDKEMSVLLIQRGKEPFREKWALPGGFIEMEETLLETGRRELKEETGLENIILHQFKSYGDPHRDPRGRTISVVFYGFTTPENSSVIGVDYASGAAGFPINRLPELAFDHNQILNDMISSNYFQSEINQ
jgi:8-oxo-dGTP diphosphatase